MALAEKKWKELLPKLGLTQEKWTVAPVRNNEEICLKLLSAWREAERREHRRMKCI